MKENATCLLLLCLLLLHALPTDAAPAWLADVPFLTQTGTPDHDASTETPLHRNSLDRDLTDVGADALRRWENAFDRLQRDEMPYPAKYVRHAKPMVHCWATPWCCSAASWAVPRPTTIASRRSFWLNRLPTGSLGSGRPERQHIALQWIRHDAEPARS